MIADVLSGIANLTDLKSMPTKKEALFAYVDTVSDPFLENFVEGNCRFTIRPRHDITMIKCETAIDFHINL